MLVETLVAEPAVAGIDEGVVGGLAWPTEVRSDLVYVAPMVERPGDKFRPVVHPDLVR